MIHWPFKVVEHNGRLVVQVEYQGGPKFFVSVPSPIIWTAADWFPIDATRDFSNDSWEDERDG